MSILDKNIVETLSAKVTNLGRKRISEGDFSIKLFKVGDSEYDYNFSSIDQGVTHANEMDEELKYPILMDNQTKLDYGVVVPNHSTINLVEEVAIKGLISGNTLQCSVECIDLNTLNGTNYIIVSSTTGYTNCEYIAIIHENTVSSTPTLSGNVATYYYKIVSLDVDDNKVFLDRPTPNMSNLNSTPKATILCLDCSEGIWNMGVVWTEKPAGLDDTYENLSGYGSNYLASIKEYCGYTSISGQTGNTTSVYLNSFGESIVVPPSQQKTVAIIHYSKADDYDVYEDYFAYDTESIAKFEVRIPFLMYHRATGTTIGQTFKMSTQSGYVISNKTSNLSIGQKYFYLIDESGNKVGKVFVHKRIIIIDDQEIVAALSIKSNRIYTLPAPRLNYIPVDLPCSPDSGLTPLLTGITKDLWVTYLLEDEIDGGKNGLHCNYYTKITGSTSATNISLKFGGGFQFLKTSGRNGFSATRFWVLTQIVDAGQLPTPDGWIKSNLTSQIPNHTDGTYIPSSGLTGHQFIITHSTVDNGSVYLLSDYIGDQPLLNEPDNLQFGDEKYFPGSVTVNRSTNIHVMNFLVNLPATQFITSQNPTKINGINPRVTEIGLFNDRNEMMVTAKASHPHEREGFQQFSITIDF